MMPSTSPCSHLEAHVLERPELLDLVALNDLPSAEEISRLAREIARLAADHVAQRCMYSRARLDDRSDSVLRDSRRRWIFGMISGHQVQGDYLAHSDQIGKAFFHLAKLADAKPQEKCCDADA